MSNFALNTQTVHMINRTLIRLKLVQMVYAYQLNEGKSIDTTDRELFHSLTQSYELYQQMFLLMMALNDVAARMVETRIARANRMKDGTVISTKFVNNRFMAQLKMNEQLGKFRNTHGNVWLEEEDFLRRLYNNISSRDFYAKYIASKQSSYDEDREIWRKVYRHTICNNDELDDILEGMSLYWNDDKAIVDTFVLKTIKRFEAENGSKQELLPDFESEDDREMASTILRAALTNAAEYQKMISEYATNWELERMARMDLVIMQVALAEITSLPEIPINVSINEYLEIAKDYSTPSSCPYVNGVLDALSHKMMDEGVIPRTKLVDKQI